jgi:hypothetical protein
MANYPYRLPILPMPAGDYVAIGTFTTATDMTSNPNIKPMIDGGELGLGTELFIEAEGELSTTASPTFQIGFWLGAVANSLVLSAATTYGAGAAAWPWKLKYHGKVKSLGPSTSASIIGQAVFYSPTSLTAWSAPIPLPATQAARTVTFDSTINREVGVVAVCSASSASNTVKVNSFSVERLN